MDKVAFCVIHYVKQFLFYVFIWQLYINSEFPYTDMGIYL